MNLLAAASFDIGGPNGAFSPAKQFASAGDLASNILLILTSISGALAIIFIILGGIKLVTAAGDEKKMQSATQTLTYAIIGLAVTALAFIILRVVQHFIGSNVSIS